MSTPPDHSLTRRRLLGAAGAAAAVSAAGQGHAAADAPSLTSPPMGRQRTEGGRSRIETIPDTTPGLEYHMYPATAFFPRDLVDGRIITSLGASPVNASDFQAPIDLPAGTVVKEMTVWVTNTNSDAAQRYLDLASFQHDADSNTYNYDLTVDIPNGQTVTNPLISTGSMEITADRNYFFNLLANPNVTIRGVRLGVVPAALSYRTVTPGRVYDSRPVQGGPGPLATGNNITISVADRINPVGGAVVQNNFVPAGARAVSLNITAVNPVGNGFFVVNPGGNSTVGASSLNWTTGENVANGIVCALNGSRQLTIVAGGSGTSANVVVDITGYYL